MGKRGLCICSGVNVLLFLVGCGLICAGLVVWLSVFPDQFTKQLKKNKVLGLNDDGSFNDYTRAWLDGSGIRQNYYFFNYTNVFGIVDRGAKPDAYEKGPYSYMKVTTYELPHDFIDNATEFEYNYRTAYIFDPVHSCPTCRPDDVFIVPDMVFQLIMDSLSTYEKTCALVNILASAALGIPPDPSQPMAICDMLGGMVPALSKVLHQLPDIIGLGVDGFTRYGPFVAVKVEDLLFKGYKDPMIDQFIGRLLNFLNSLNIEILGKPIPIPHNIPSPPIHLFVNNSLSDKYTVLTGNLNYLDIGKIVGFTNENGTEATNGSSLPENWWSPPENLTSCTDDLKKHASQLNGTSGQFFHVLLHKDSKPYVYVEDICRSIRFIYDSEVTVRNVAGYRFVIDPNTFNYGVPENCGFCTKLTAEFYDRPEGSFCLPDGLLHLGGCKAMPMQLPASFPLHLIKLPIAASNPHFYGADQEVIDLFPRFNPSREDDMTTLDIEPQTGTLLRANKRIQMNIMFRRLPNVSSFSNILPGAYPMFWINETYTIDDSSWRSLKNDVLGTKQTIKLVCYIVGVGLGALLVVISLVSCFANVCCVNRPREHSQVREESKFEENRPSSSVIRTDSTVQLRARPVAARRKE